MKKHKEIVIISLIVICFLVTVSYVGNPIRNFFIVIGLPSSNAKYITILILRTAILIVAIWGLDKLRLRAFNGFGEWFKIRHFQAWISILLFSVLILIVNFNLFLQTNPIILTLFISSNIAIGLTEELIFRGTVLPLFISLFRHNKNVLILSVICSSLIFGLGHYTNLINHSINFEGISNQVFMATAVGIIAGIIMLRTKNILIVSLLHGILNISMSTRSLIVSNIQPIEITTQGSTESGYFVPLLVLLLLILIGYFLIKNVDSKSILRSLNL